MGYRFKRKTTVLRYERIIHWLADNKARCKTGLILIYFIQAAKLAFSTVNP
jgi:hypothetical protein